jgi:DnaJ-domain-containing protein 1
MPAFLILLPLIAIGAAGYWWLRARSPAERARRGRYLLGGGMLATGVVLTLRGGMALGLPVGLLGLGILGFDLRGMTGGTSAPPPPTSSARMSREEACELLGLDPKGEINEDAVNTAYRALMKRVHPDVGGSDGLSRKLQEARDALLGPR